MDKHVGTELKAAIGDLQTLAARLLDDGRAWWNNRRDDMGRYEQERGEQRYQSGSNRRSQEWSDRGSETWRQDEAGMHDDPGFHGVGSVRQGRGAPSGPQPGREQENTRGYRGYAESASASGAGKRYAHEQYQDDGFEAGSGTGQAAYGHHGGSGGYEYGNSGYSQGRHGYGRDADQNLGQSGYGQPGLGQGGYGQYGSRARDQFDQGQAQSGTGVRSQGQFRGRGPKGYSRSDERMTEDLNERLTDDSLLDASEISVEVKDGVATLRGTVDSRWMKHRAEDIADACTGVQDVRNEIRVGGIERGTDGVSQAPSSDGAQERASTTASDRDSQADGSR